MIPFVSLPLHDNVVPVYTSAAGEWTVRVRVCLGGKAKRDRRKWIANIPAMSFKMKQCTPSMIYDTSCKHTYVVKGKSYATAYNANFTCHVQDLFSEIHKSPQ